MWGTIFAAAIGAFSANLISELVKSRSRKEQLTEQNRDHDLARMLQTVRELRELGEEYWTKGSEGLAAEEQILRAKIVARQQHTLSLVAGLFTDAPKRDCDVQFGNVMDALTGGNFGPGCEKDLDRLQSIYEAMLEFEQMAITRRRSLKRGWLA